MKIRYADINDLERINTIEQLCFPVTEAATKKQLEERIQTYPENFLVLEDKDIVGFINGNSTNSQTIEDIFFEDIHTHNSDGDYMSVFGLSVHPDYRHQGIATKLMKAYQELAISRHKKGIILTCKDHLIPFYESLGFKHLGISQSTHGNVKWNDMLWEIYYDC